MASQTATVLTKSEIDNICITLAIFFSLFTIFQSVHNFAKQENNAALGTQIHTIVQKLGERTGNQ